MRAPSHPSLHAGPITGPIHGAIAGPSEYPSEAPAARAIARGLERSPVRGAHRTDPPQGLCTGLCHGDRTAPTTRIWAPKATPLRDFPRRPPRTFPAASPAFPASLDSSAGLSRDQTQDPPLAGAARSDPRNCSIKGWPEEGHYDEALFLSLALPERHSASPLPGSVLWIASGPIVTQISGHLARLAAGDRCGEGGRCQWQ